MALVASLVMMAAIPAADAHAQSAADQYIPSPEPTPGGGDPQSDGGPLNSSAAPAGPSDGESAGERSGPAGGSAGGSAVELPGTGLPVTGTIALLAALALALLAGRAAYLLAGRRRKPHEA